ncbi:PAS domain-containing protein, partial [candidate division KSB3 bacterium]|nr:PAS domain-containing protein [candidate division KSB3 bacterium]MBD3324725.1 PAS domain-containing protein [candidate division KSB3 bacterium]
MNYFDPIAAQFALLDHMPIGALVLQPDFTVMFWNSRLEDWTGIPRAEIVGHSIGAYFPHLTTPRYAIRIQDVFTSGTPVLFSSYLHNAIIPVTLSDKRRQIQLTTVTRVPGRETGECYVLFSIQDVTELTHRIRDYRLMRDQAQKEIAERQRAEEALHDAKEAAEAANRAKSAFLTNMSHELRTPLNAIIGFSQVLAHSSRLAPEDRDQLSIIRRNGEHLLTLINQVLDVSKIEAGRMTLDAHSFALPPLLHDLIEMFQLQAEQKGLQLCFDFDPNLPCYVATDEVKLRQVLINLLNNAIKFTEHGTVSLKVHMANSPQESGEGLAMQDDSPSTTRLLFEVTDTGLGIAPEDLQQIFHPFFKTSSGQRKQEGTGLGL